MPLREHAGNVHKRDFSLAVDTRFIFSKPMSRLVRTGLGSLDRVNRDIYCIIVAYSQVARFLD